MLAPIIRSTVLRSRRALGLSSPRFMCEATAEATATTESSARHTRNKENFDDLTIHKAVAKAKSLTWAKFDETVEIAINTGLDPRKPNQSIKGVASLPSGTGKTVRVCVFANGSDAKDAMEAGAEVVGAEDLVIRIQGGEMNFDTVIASPDMMAIVGKLGRVSSHGYNSNVILLLK